jgi:hypothetical protein
MNPDREMERDGPPAFSLDGDGNNEMRDWGHARMPMPDFLFRNYAGQPAMQRLCARNIGTGPADLALSGQIGEP